MGKSIQLYFAVFLLMFLLGCKKQPPAPTATKTINLLQVDLLSSLINIEQGLPSDQHPLVLLEGLDTNTPHRVWEQFFSERGAIKVWETLQQRGDQLFVDFASFTSNPLVCIGKRADEVAAGVIRYLVCYSIAIEDMKLGWNKLDATNDQLTSLPAEIEKLPSLKILDLGDNNLEDLPANIGQLTDLETLDISNNSFNELTVEVCNLAKLKFLELSINNISKLPADIANLTNLRELDLASNQLQSLPAQIGQLTNLKVLNLSYNLLTVLPPEIGNLINLQWLDLSYNLLADLPPGMSRLASLQYFDLVQNQLTKLPSSLIPLLDKLLKEYRNKMSRNPWLTPAQLVPISSDTLKSKAYQTLPSSLLTLCIACIKNHVRSYPQQQEDIEASLAQQFCQAASIDNLIESYRFMAGKNIVFFQGVSFRNLPFYLDYTLRTHQDINDMLKDVEGKQLYQVTDLPSWGCERIGNI